MQRKKQFTIAVLNQNKKCAEEIYYKHVSVINL